ncbi:MAG: hypothetical protein AB8B62_15780 [Roseobacter sp.]
MILNTLGEIRNLCGLTFVRFDIDVAIEIRGFLVTYGLSFCAITGFGTQRKNRIFWLESADRRVFHIL